MIQTLTFRLSCKKCGTPILLEQPDPVDLGSCVVDVCTECIKIAVLQVLESKKVEFTDIYDSMEAIVINPPGKDDELVT